MKWAVLVLVIIAVGAGASFAESSTGGDSTDPQPPPPDPAPLDSFDVPDFSSGVGMQLRADQIAQYAANAGFQGADLTTAVAIALAESGGQTGVYNPVDNFDSGKPANTPQGQGAIGLWQIYLNAHPEFRGTDLTDPQANADAAFAVYSAAGNSFRPWTTYTTGKFARYLSAAQQVTA